ncbi:MAG: rod shape-determining protein [Candidatus Dormibacteria bacterium]
MASRRFGIELSPDHVEVWARGDGVVLEEPAALARQQGSGRSLAFGTQALEAAHERPGQVVLSWPLGTRRLADQRAAEQLLRLVIFKVVGRMLFTRHELMLGVPTELTTQGRRVLLEAALASGARMAHMMDLPLAAALGAGMPVASWAPAPLLFLTPRSAQAAVICHEGLLGHRSLEPREAGPGTWEGDWGVQTLAGLLAGMFEELAPRQRDQARRSGLALAGRGVALGPIGGRLEERLGVAPRLVPDPGHCVAKGSEVALERIDALGSQGLLYLR